MSIRGLAGPRGVKICTYALRSTNQCNFSSMDYKPIYLVNRARDRYDLIDHAGGFDHALKNYWLDSLVGRSCIVSCEYNISPSLQSSYPEINFEFGEFKKTLFAQLQGYTIHPAQKFRHFLCSFNGTPHVSRKLLVAALQRWGYFYVDTCSKNFKFTEDIIDGHLDDYLDEDQTRFYRKFFIDQSSIQFFQTIYSFGHNRYDHAANICHLADTISQCFLHVVSESVATSYYPFVSEKFLYSIVTRGLFLAYAQPGWHEHLKYYYGFRQYDKIFDYRFDEIKNPVARLVELMSMISKFSNLSSDDWRDLYEIEIDTVEYNYDHYRSKRYLACLDRWKSSYEL